MPVVPVPVYDAGRGAAPAANLTDQKTAAAAGNSYTFPNDGHVLLLCNSTAGCNLVMTRFLFVDGDQAAGKTTAIPAGKVAPLGPYPALWYADPATGLASFTVSAACDVLLVRAP